MSKAGRRTRAERATVRETAGPRQFEYQNTMTGNFMREQIIREGSPGKRVVLPGSRMDRLRSPGNYGYYNGQENIKKVISSAYNMFNPNGQRLQPKAEKQEPVRPEIMRKTAYDLRQNQIKEECKAIADADPKKSYTSKPADTKDEQIKNRAQNYLSQLDWLPGMQNDMQRARSSTHMGFGAKTKHPQNKNERPSTAVMKGGAQDRYVKINSSNIQEGSKQHADDRFVLKETQRNIDINTMVKGMPKEIYAKGGFGPKKHSLLRSGEVNLGINHDLGQRKTAANPKDGKTTLTSYSSQKARPPTAQIHHTQSNFTIA